MGVSSMETPKLPRMGDTESNSDMKMAMTEESDDLSNMSAPPSEPEETDGAICCIVRSWLNDVQEVLV